MADSAVIPIRGDNADLEAKLDQAVAMLQGWGGKVKTVFAGLGVAVLAKKAFDFGAGFIQSAMEAEKGAALLDQTISNLGSRATMTAEEVKAFAAEMMNLTTFEDDAAIAAQTLFMRLDSLDAKSIKRATVAAADLATVMGTDLDAAARKITAAMKDPERAIGGLKAAGIKFTAAEEEMIIALAKAGKEAEAQEIILSKLEGTIGGSAAKAGQTAGGQWEIFKNKMSDCGEAIGTAMLPALAALQPVLETFSTWVSEIAVPAIASIIAVMVDWGKAILDVLGPVFKWMVDTGVWAFTAVQTGIQNFCDVAKLALVGFTLGVVKAFEIVKHFLVEAMPQYLSWFGRNWTNIFTDLFNLTITVFKNLWTNITSFWDGLKSFLSGGEFTLELTPLTEGFQAITEELPKIAERVKGDLEMGLEQSAEQLSTKIGGAFKENLAANRKALGLDKPDAAPKKPSIIEKPADNSKALAEAKKEGEKTIAEAEKEKEKKSKDKADKKDVQATFEDLASLNQRVQSAAASSKEDKQVKAVEEAGDKQVAAIEKVVDGQAKLLELAKQQTAAAKATEEKIEKVGTLA